MTETLARPRPPARIPLGPTTYRVVHDLARLVELEDVLQEKLAGCSRQQEGEIILRPGIPLDVERETLWHEITHQALRVVAGHIELSRADEERIVAAIAWNQLDTLRRCPELVEYLTTKES